MGRSAFARPLAAAVSLVVFVSAAHAIPPDRDGNGLRATPPHLQFGSIEVGSVSHSRHVRVRNLADETAIVFALSLSPGYQLGAHTCFDASLAPGESCEIDLTSAPTAAGVADGTLRVQFCFPSDPICPGAIFGQERLIDVPLRSRGR
jgi:hypothetical protein